MFLHSEKQNNWQTITGHKFRRSHKFRMTPEQRFPKNTNPVQHKRVTSLPSLTSIFQRTELNRSMINGWRRRSAVQIYTEILFCTSSTTCNIGLHEVCGNVLTIAIQWISNEQVIRDFVFIYKVTLFRKFATIYLVWDSQKLTNINSLDNVYNKNYHAGKFLCHIPLLCKTKLVCFTKQQNKKKQKQCFIQTCVFSAYVPLTCPNHSCNKRTAWGCRGCGRIPNAENLATIWAKIFKILAKYTATFTCIEVVSIFQTEAK